MQIIANNLALVLVATAIFIFDIKLAAAILKLGILLLTSILLSTNIILQILLEINAGAIILLLPDPHEILLQTPKAGVNFDRTLNRGHVSERLFLSAVSFLDVQCGLQSGSEFGRGVEY